MASSVPFGRPARALCALALVSSACRPPPPAAPVTASPAALVVSRLDSVPVTWTPEDRQLRAWSPRGEVLWAVTLPDSDAALAPPTVAPDSSLYVRGQRALYAISAKGELSWSKRLAPEVEPPEGARAPAAMMNSGVVYAADPRTLVALTPDGVEMWKHLLAVGESLRSSPVITPDGLIAVVTSTGVVQLAADGVPRWRGSVGARSP